MKTVLFTFAFDDHRAREVLASVRGMLDRLHYCVISPLDVIVGEKWNHSISEQLRAASVAIAFLTERSPQILFEAGYAYGLGKQLILVSDMSALPFDLRTVAAVDARSSSTEIAFEIVRQISRLDDASWEGKPHPPEGLREMLNAAVHRPELFEMVSRDAFERAIAGEFKTRGFNIDFPEGSHEAGFDMRIRDNAGRSLLVEVKKLNPNSKVSISSVQQLLGAAHAYNDSAALLICTSEFTLSARDFARWRHFQLTLWTLLELRLFVERRGDTARLEEVIKGK